MSELRISTHSAWSKDKGSFHGTLSDGREFKFVCPKCKAEGDELRHRNWYMAKEAGEPLVLGCETCGNEVIIDGPMEPLMPWIIILECKHDWETIKQNCGRQQCKHCNEIRYEGSDE